MKPTKPPVQNPVFSVRLPPMVSDEDAGLGDTVARAARRLGIQPCGGCNRRAAFLNRLVAYRRSV